MSGILESLDEAWACFLDGERSKDPHARMALLIPRQDNDDPGILHPTYGIYYHNGPKRIDGEPIKKGVLVRRDIAKVMASKLREYEENYDRPRWTLPGWRLLGVDGVNFKVFSVHA